MLHIALATVAGDELLVSWNLRHIVRLGKICLFNALEKNGGNGTIDMPAQVRVF